MCIRDSYRPELYSPLPGVTRNSSDHKGMTCVSMCLCITYLFNGKNEIFNVTLFNEKHQATYLNVVSC